MDLDRNAPAGCGDPGRGVEPVALRVAPRLSYSKADVFDICAALALAESVLRRLGRDGEAAVMASAFEAAEAGLSGR
jgi:hypothetical protein